MKRALIALGAISVIAMSACGTLFSPAAAVVNGKKITIGEVENALDEFLPSEQHDQLIQQGADDLAVQRQFEQFYLTSIVKLRVFEAEAAELGVTPSEKEIDAGVEEVKSSYGDTFEKVLDRVGLDLQTIRNFVTLDLLESELKAKVTASAVPTDAELREFYDSHIDDYTRTRASHILVDDEQLADRISKRLQDAPTDEVDSLFATLAKRYSTDNATADRGGDIGFLTIGQIPEEFANAALALAPGEVSDPVHTSFGWHVIEVTDRKVQPFEEVKDAIETLIGSPAEDKLWHDFLVQSYQDADVKVNPRFGELDIETQQIVNASSAQVPGVAGAPSPSPSPLPLLTPGASSS